MSSIAQTIKMDRKSKGLTQEQYAKSMGVQSATAVSLWESGARSVPNRVVEVILGYKLPEYHKCSACNGTGMTPSKPNIDELLWGSNNG